MSDAALVQEVLDYWFGAPGSPDYGKPQKKWFGGGVEIDEEIRGRFAEANRRAVTGELDRLTRTPEGMLAVIILIDQFSRHIHRDQAGAFAGDPHAFELAERAIAEGLDRRIPVFQRMFIYMPLMHCERIEGQKRALEIFGAYAPLTDDPAMMMRQAQRHHDEVARFGRFPYRNKALGRPMRPEEEAYILELEEERRKWRAEREAQAAVLRQAAQ